MINIFDLSNGFEILVEAIVKKNYVQFHIIANLQKDTTKFPLRFYIFLVSHFWCRQQMMCNLNYHVGNLNGYIMDIQYISVIALL